MWLVCVVFVWQCVCELGPVCYDRSKPLLLPRPSSLYIYIVHRLWTVCVCVSLPLVRDHQCPTHTHTHTHKHYTHFPHKKTVLTYYPSCIDNQRCRAMVGALDVFVIMSTSASLLLSPPSHSVAPRWTDASTRWVSIRTLLLYRLVPSVSLRLLNVSLVGKNKIIN